MADNILDRDKHPDWQGERTKMLYAMPIADKLWAEYEQIRAEDLKNERGLARATAFYVAHREAMDEGAVVAWPARHNPDEASALQHAMDLKYQDEAAFFAEYQNEPLDQVMEEGVLTADEVAAKTNGMERGEVSVSCTHLTAFIDVQQKLLFYVLAGWEDDFTGFVLDYGTYPDQGKGYFTMRETHQTLSRVAPKAGMEGAIYAGLEELTERILGKEWRRDDRAMMRVERCLIDANWGQSTDLVYQFCRQSRFAPILLPSHGKHVGASSIPFSEYTRKRGDRVGHNWRIPNVHGKRAVRHAVYDTNYWKSFIHSRLAVPMGDPGGLSLFGRKPEAHRLFGEHLTAEYKVRTEGRGRVVDEWKAKPHQPDNHWFDGTVGCAVAASIVGVSLPGTEQKAQRRPTRVKLSGLRRQVQRQPYSRA
jgi:hypothetical protein